MKQNTQPWTSHTEKQKTNPYPPLWAGAGHEQFCIRSFSRSVFSQGPDIAWRFKFTWFACCVHLSLQSLRKAEFRTLQRFLLSSFWLKAVTQTSAPFELWGRAGNSALCEVNSGKACIAWVSGNRALPKFSQKVTLQSWLRVASL